MDKSEKARREQILNELRQNQQHKFESGLPVNREMFENLFNYLDDQLGKHDCDDTIHQQ
jgi:hypothetical protein